MTQPMGAPQPVQAVVWQDGDTVLTARARNIDGGYILQSEVASIALTVKDRTDNVTVPGFPIALTVSAVIFDTIQAADGIIWRADQIGYNFRYRLAGAAAFPSAHDYKISVVATLTDGTKYPICQWLVSAEEVP